MKKIYLIFLLSCFTTSFSQNINSTILETNWGGDSEPDHLKVVSGKLFFSANIALFYNGNGRELWVKDSPSSKSRVVKDINSNGSAIEANSDFINLNGLLLFTARASNLSYKQLWKSDGTSEGTTLVKTINPSYDTKINNPIVFGKKLYFTTYINNSSELWVTDGTTDGTFEIKKINPSGNSNVNNLFVFQNKIYFTANDGIHGDELWRTDGSNAGTEMVRDFFPGNGGGVFRKPIVYKNNLILIGRQTELSFAVWKWDFTSNEVNIIQSLPNSYNPDFFAVENNDFVYFNTRVGNFTNLWKTDGSASGTQKISTGTAENYVILEPLVKYKNQIYFRTTQEFNYKTWVLNMNDDSISELSAVIPALENTSLLSASSEGNYLLFDKGDKKYVSDGTLTGTKEITDVEIISNYSGYSYNIVEYDNNLFMNAKTAENGVELYSYNFAEGKTQLVEDLNHLIGSDYITSETLNGKLIYFGSKFNSGTEIFESDGTIAGTKIVKDLNPSQGGGIVYSGDNPKFFKHNNKLYFRCTNGSSGYEPCITDGTPDGTKILKDISRFNQSVNHDPYFMKLNDEIVLFGADDGSNNTASASNLWRTDGTEEGTYQLSLINVVSPNYAKINNKIYYSTYNRVVNDKFTYSIAETDGTQAGTKIFKTLYNDAGMDTYATILGEVNNRMLYAYRYSAAWGYGTYLLLFSSDGVSNSPDLQLGKLSGLSVSPIGTHVFKNKMYFHAQYYGKDYYSLYETDGTIQGTKLVSNVFDTNSSEILEYTQCGNKLYIKSGSKILVTDGNNSFLKLIDEPSSNFKTLKCLSGNIFFTDWKYQNYKIWTSNGTSAGTKPLNLYVDGASTQNLNSISDIAVTDNQLFIIAWFSDLPNVRDSGQELYIADISDLNLNNNEVNAFKIEKDKSFIIYPNPASEIINIIKKDNESIQSVDILSIDGKKIKTWTNQDFSKINLKHIISGNYILLINMVSGKIESHKIIKK